MVHSIIAMICYFCLQETHHHIFLFTPIEYFLLLFNPLESCTGHRQEMHRLCIVHRKSNKLRTIWIIGEYCCLVSPSNLFLLLLILNFFLNHTAWMSSATFSSHFMTRHLVFTFVCFVEKFDRAKQVIQPADMVWINKHLA
jgi:hypothetical protein